ncbi:Pectate lyase [Phytophthora nicotianae]|uniref:Pectate lyase n=1 Tax=Phytophthora nicotianae TaxID=4792 RepID=A0A0W8CHJ6_PHYNI|nr:Pectate lyase [Phytophthora nicotianae]
MARSYRLGDTWFVVSCGWWQRVVERGDTPTDSRIRNSDIVDAKRSCRCCSRSILHPNLMEDVDFRLVSEPVWSALSLEFGYDWAVRREVVTMGRRLGVDVYPSGLEERATGHGHIPNSEAVAPSPPSSPTREEWTPVKLEQWRSELKLDQSVDALDTDSRWYEAKIVDITDSRVKKEKQVENELLAQQSEISAELQAVRRQLNDFQDKWKKSVEAKAGESSEASTVQSSWPSPISVRHVRTGFQETAVQTENDEREHAVTQWLLLLTQKLETLTRKYSHEPTQSFQASMTYLARVWGPNDDSNGLLKETKETNNGSGEADEGPALSSWHVGRDLKAAVPLEVAEQFLELEHSIASLNTAVEQHERRQMTNFDRAIQQVQGFHQERIQKVVDESLAELKLVRGRYKKKEAQLEDELRAANKEIEQWKLTAAEAEHRKKLDRESLEFQLTAAKEQVVSQHRDTHEVIAQAKEGAVALERQCQALKKQQERAKELHDREIRVLQDSVRQLREGKDDMELRHAKEKQALIETIEKLEAKQTDTQEARIRGEIEQQIIPERLASLENQHQETVSAMESEHKRQLAELAARLDETKRSAPSTVRSIETQTDSLPVEKSTRKNYKVEASDAQAQIEGLTRRCQALEKLLDKKFEETSYSSQRCESCHSDDGISVSSVLERHDLNASRSSIHSDSFRPRVSGKSRALARALLGSSRASMNSVSSDSKASPFMNETTLATDEATLGAHEMWDSASFTSIDTVDDLSSQRTTPRQRMRSTQEILTLVRQIKQTAASPLDRREPDPEVNWGTPKQKSTMSRGFNSKGAGKSAAPNSSHSTGEDTSVTPGTSIFDDLLC